MSSSYPPYVYDFQPVEHFVSRPDVSGAIGGKHIGRWKFFSEMAYPSFTPKFAEIRSSLDTLLDNWLELPNPASFESAMDELGDNVDITFAINSNGELEASGQIAGYLLEIADAARLLVGRTFVAFKANFLNRIGPTIGNFHGITRAIATGLNAERELWERAREDVVNGFFQLEDGFETYASSQSATNWSLVLKVIGAVSDGLEFVGDFYKPAKIAGTIGEHISKLMTASVGLSDSQDDSTVNADNYDSLMAVARTYFSSLATSVLKEEQYLKEAIVEADIFLYDAVGLFLEFDAETPYENDFSDLSKLKITEDDEGEIDPIYTVILPLISKKLRGSKSSLMNGGIVSSTPWIRPDRIGICYNGCFGAWNNLVWHLGDLIDNLADKVDDAAHLLKVSIEGILNQDADLGRIWKDALQDANSGYQNKDPSTPQYLTHSRDYPGQIGGF